MRAKPLTIAFGAVVIVGALGACRASPADHRRDAEEFLRSDEVFQAYGVDFTDPECEEPSSARSGTTFSCTARADGQEFTFTLRIDGRNEVVLEALNPSPTEPP
jgi:hypothetical protein